MKNIHFPTVLVVAAIFIFGFFIGYSMKGADEGKKININPFPKSCVYEGNTYKPGESFPSGDGCNTCTCNNGEVACTLIACASETPPEQ